MTLHRTKPEHAAVAGWIDLDDEWEITVLPVLDRRYVLDDGGSVLARPTYADAITIAKEKGAQLATPAQLKAKAKLPGAIVLKPFLGTPTAETSLHHSKLHDAYVNAELIKRGWTGLEAVVGAGKHWVDPDDDEETGPDEDADLDDYSHLWGWDKDGDGPGTELWQPRMRAHKGRNHHDDGTTLELVRRRGSEIVHISEIPPPSSGGDTLPSVEVPWLDPELLHGERLVVWLEAQIAAGIKEVPNGSNNSPVIGPWLRKCVRDGKGASFGRYLAKTGANWCAAARCAAIDATRSEGDLDVGHLYRCSGIELEKDTKASGWYRPVSLVLIGEWKPELGDGVLLPRGKPGGWQRHVATFIGWAGDGRIQTIDGNKGNRIQTWEYGLHELLGFFEMPSRDPRHNYRGVAPELPDEIDDLNDGENAVA